MNKKEVADGCRFSPVGNRNGNKVKPYSRGRFRNLVSYVADNIYNHYEYSKRGIYAIYTRICHIRPYKSFAERFAAIIGNRARKPYSE